MEILNIPYDTVPSSRDHFREFDLYLPRRPLVSLHASPPPILCFIHGGAWRAEDKTDHKALARSLVASTHYPVAVPNYHLTPRDPPTDDHFKHPGHAQDLLDFLTFLTQWPGPSGIGMVYDRHHLYLMGHSCSAHMLTSIFLDSSSITPQLTPPGTLLRAVRGIILSEGIYDLELLLADFPNYREWFIGPTFGQNAVYASFSTTNFPLRNSDVRWLVIHSKGDTLVNLPQSQAIYRHLRHSYGPHADARVRSNMDQLQGDHNDIFRGDGYVNIVTRFVLQY